MPRYIFVFLLLLFCLPLTNPASAKPAPPPQLINIFSELIELEEDVQEAEWNQAEARLGEIRVDVEGIEPTLSAAVPATLLAAFREDLESFRQALKTRQIETGYQTFFSLHQNFLEIMGHFAYKLPPLLFIVQNDLREARQAVLEGDFAEAGDELNEIEIFYRKSLPILAEKGVSDKIVGTFQAKTLEAKAAVTAQDHQLALTRVGELQQLFELQHSLVTSR